MDRQFLVDVERVASSHAAEEIRERRPDIGVIVAAKFSDYSSPRLVLASTQFEDVSLLPSYKEVLSILGEMGDEQEDVPSLLLLPETDSFIRDLRRNVGRVNRSTGMHIEGRSLGDRFLEDGYVFHVN